MYDIVLLTDRRYLKDYYSNNYSANVILEDKLVKDSLEAVGLKVWRTNWDNPDFDWSQTRTVLFRTTWDYFDRYAEFMTWLTKINKLTKTINDINLIRWNLDKHYLIDLDKAGIPIIQTYFIEARDKRTLRNCIDNAGFGNSIVIKPAIAGAARHCYKISLETADKYEHTFLELIKNEALLLQPFMNNVPVKGEISGVVIDGKYTHGVLKKAQEGDFRVQDNFNGTVHNYEATKEEIYFIENAISKVKPVPAYGRVDIVWDNDDNLAVSELELIEPELWFRNNPESANILAQTIVKILKN